VTVPIALQVLLVLLRETLRAVLVPLRVLAYVPFRKHWRKVAREVLDSAAAAPVEETQQALEGFFARRRPRHGARPHLFVSAGEASGEAHAARLVRALGTDVRCTAFGGHALADAGAELRFALSEHAVMGVHGVLRQLPLLVRAVVSYLRLLRDDPPDLVVLVDYPGLHVVMAKQARRLGIPVLHYVAPQYWAWGPWRMRRYRRSVDATLTILPFETAFFRRFRIPAAYIGHPLLDELERHPPDAAAVAAVRNTPTLVLLPGSRRAEIAANLPGMLRVAQALRAADPRLRVVLPHKDPRRSATLRDALAAHGATFVEYHEGPLGPWLAGARLVLAKSGTGSLEACLSGSPTIVVYQLRGMLAALGYHNILSVPWIAAANLVAGRRVVPEFCFHHRGGWDDVQRAAEQLWLDGPERTAAVQGLAEVRQRLGAPGATARVAAIVRTFLFPEGRVSEVGR
jgi:lipid-A-disaccharide synthase